MLALAPIFLIIGICESGDIGYVPWDRALERVLTSDVPRWSSDGEYIVAAVHRHNVSGTIYVVRSDGLETHMVSEGANDETIEISPDISSTAGAVQSYSGETRVVYATATYERNPFSDVGGLDFQIETSRPDGSDKRRLRTTYSDEFAPTWSPDGSHIAFVRSSGKRDDGIYISSSGGGYEFPAVLFRKGYEDDREITGIGGEIRGPVWDPTGRKLAFTSEGFDEQSPTSLYLVELDNDLIPGKLVKLFDEASFSDEVNVTVGPPAWSPGGDRLALLLHGGFSNNRRHLTLYTINADGSDLQEIINVEEENYRLGGDKGVVDWSPDGKEILFSWSENRRYGGGAPKGTLYLVNVDGTNLREIGTGTYASWSPDGSRIAVSHHEYNGAIHDLSTMAPDGSNVQILLEKPSR